MNELEKRQDFLDRRRQEVRAFLDQATTELRAGGGDTYDLVSEFRKTKKNRSPLVPIVISLVVVLVTMGAWWLTARIDQQARRVSVDIAAFEDLNLRDLLDVAKRSIEELDEILRDIDLLEQELAVGLESIQRERASAKAVNLASGLAEEDLAARDAEVDREAIQKERTLRSQLEARIAEKTALKEELERRVASYDTRSLEQAKKTQETMDNQQRLFELEKNQLTEFYEKRISALEKSLKDEKATGDERVRKTTEALTTRYTRELAFMEALYNPTWTDEAALAVMSSAEKANPTVSLQQAAALAKELPIRPTDYSAVSRQYSDFLTNLKRLQQIPFKNSVPPYLKAAESAVNLITANYDLLAREAVSVIQERNQRIADRESQIAQLESDLAFERAERTRIEYGLSGLTRRESTAGYIIDQRDTSRLLIYIDPLYTVSGRTRAWAFREDDAAVAELVLWQEGSAVVGSLVRLEPDMTLRPFDCILLGPSEVSQ